MERGKVNRLETMIYKGTEYTIDFRIQQFRNIERLEFIDFRSVFGGVLMENYYKSKDRKKNKIGLTKPRNIV
jgi:hypothetical protein